MIDDEMKIKSFKVLARLRTKDKSLRWSSIYRDWKAEVPQAKLLWQITISDFVDFLLFQAMDMFEVDANQHK